MTRKTAIWVVLVVGLGLIVAPFVFDMWVRAPRGAEMISDFKPYMTQARATQFEEDYLPSIAVGFGTVPLAVGDAAAHYGNGASWTYSQSATFLQSHPNLGSLSYVQQNFPTMAAPFSNMVGVMVRDVNAFNGVAGLPPFWLFPFFFVLPGLILVVVGFLLLRRQRSQTRSGRAPQWVALILGTGLALAPFLPMPPGWGLMWVVAPPGAHMIDDFASPATGVAGTAPIMSHETAALFGRYLSYMQAAHREITPAVQAVAADYGQTISSADARAFIASDPKLGKVSDIVDRFPTMYSGFHGMLTVMAKDVVDYQAVKALPPFTLFPYFFIIPGVIAAVAGAVILLGDAGLARRREYEQVRLKMGLKAAREESNARV